MGQFEIKGEKTVKLEPDIINLNVYAEILEIGVEDKDKEVEKVKDRLKTSVVDLVKRIENTSDKCKVSFSDLTYTKTKMSSTDKPKTFGKKTGDNLINLKASTKITLKIKTRDEEVLVNILDELLKELIIIHIYSDVESSDLDYKYRELTREVCKECRSRADIVVESLGSSIVGIDKIVYNSNGKFLSQDNNTVQPALFGLRSIDKKFDKLDFDECCTDDLESEVDAFSDAQLEYNKAWAEGFVKDILDKRTVLSDSVSVVFRID